jgi:hypothetical protein
LAQNNTKTGRPDLLRGNRERDLKGNDEAKEQSKPLNILTLNKNL